MLTIKYGADRQRAGDVFFFFLLCVCRTLSTSKANRASAFAAGV